MEAIWWPRKQATLQQTSLDTYERDLRLRVLPAIGDLELSRVTRHDVQRMVSGCASASTARKARSVARAMFNDAMDDGLASSNPAEGRFDYPRRTRSGTRGEWLTTFPEHRELLEAARGSGNVEAILLLGLCFGLRKEEILGLDVGDLDFGHGYLHVERAYVATSKGNLLKETKTEESERTLPMTEYARRRLSAMTEGLPPDVPVCRNSSGGRLSPSTAQKQLHRWLEDNGMPMVTIQTLRHSFASACIDSGIDVAKVSAWLGHTNVTTTLDRYVKVRSRDLDAAASRIDAAIGCRDVAGTAPDAVISPGSPRKTA